MIIDQTKATMYLKDGISAGKQFGSVYRLRRQALAGGESVRVKAMADSCLLNVPLIGAVNYGDRHGDIHTVDAGKALYAYVVSGASVEMKNYYDDGGVDILYVL